MTENEDDGNGSLNSGATSTVTTPPTTTITTTTAKTHNNSNNGSNKYKGKGNEKYSANSFGSNENDWEGAKADFGAVLGLNTEKLKKKVTYEIFREKAKTYILSEFKNPKDVLPTLRLVDPLDGFKGKYAPKKLEGDAAKDDIEKEMQTLRIKRYMAREDDVRSNMDKLYGIIVGQCSEAVLSVLENDSDYIAKDEDCDVIWLLTKVKVITSGLDSKSNKRSNLHEALLLLTKMQQGNEELDDSYLKRFKANVDNLTSAGG